MNTTKKSDERKWKGCLFKSSGRRSQHCACAACAEWRNDNVAKSWAKKQAQLRAAGISTAE